MNSVVIASIYELYRFQIRPYNDRKHLHIQLLQTHAAFLNFISVLKRRLRKKYDLIIKNLRRVENLRQIGKLRKIKVGKRKVIINNE